MRFLFVGVFVMAFACGPKTAEEPTEVETEAESEADDVPVSEVEAPLSEEEAPVVEPQVEREVVEPPEVEASGVEKRKRYRHGGSRIRKGSRAVELKGAVDGKGKRFRLESRKAPLLVLTFGASWCAPCKKELPALEKLAKKYAPAMVDFVAVNIDSSLTTGKAFMKRAGLKRVEAAYDIKSLSVGSYDPPTMPSVFLIQEGIVKHVHAGYRSGDDKKLKKAIDRLL